MTAEFLTTIWGQLGPGRYGELRVISNGHVNSSYSHSVEALVEHSRSANLDGDVYYGVIPRTRMEGKASACEDYTSVLWADVDAKGRDKWAIMQSLRDESKLKQTPSIIVDSGHGFHLYWLLREPALFPVAEGAMRILAKEVLGDAVYDKARILRVPGTTNKKHELPAPVRIVYWDIERKYRIRDFTLPTVHVSPLRSVVPRSAPSWLEELITQGAPRGQRSEASFRAAVWMIRYGWTDEEIAGAFDATPWGIGEKYHEKGNGKRWLELTLKAARRAADLRD
jgi:hypothetical protein